MPLTQSQIVLEHLRKHGSITQMEATNKYRMTRLGAVIFRLKEKGWIIKTHIVKGINSVTGGRTQYAKYVLEE